MATIEETGEDAADAPAQRKPARLLLRNRDYTGWWIGETVSQYGSALSTVAYPLLILAVTGSAAQAGVVTAASSIGLLATMLIGGALADRFSRRTLLIAGPLIEAVVVGTVVLAVAAGHVSVLYVAAVGFVQGMVGGASGGAAFATLRRVVPPEQLPTAFAQMQGRTMAVRLAGPTSGGFLFGIARWVPFLGDALSFLLSAGGAALIRRPLGPDPEEITPHESIFASIAEGFRYIRGNAYLRFLTAWAALANASMSGLNLLVIVLIHDRHGSAVLIGAVTSIGAAGGLLGAFLSRRIAQRVKGRTLVIAVSWLAAGVIAGLAFIPNPWLIGLLLALLMVLIAPLNVVFSTYEARSIPDALMGRVSTAIDFGAASIRWAGPLGAGWLAASCGATWATLVFGGVQGGIAISTLIARGLYVLNQPIDEVVAEA